MSELNPDPRMRPSIDALISKLRKMSMLKGKPEAAAFVIHDMMYQHLYNDGPHPSALWEIMLRAQNLWQMSLGINGRLEVDRAALIQADQPVPDAVAHQLGLRIVNNVRSWHCACGTDFYTQEDYDAHLTAISSWKKLEEPTQILLAAEPIRNIIRDALEANQVGMKQIIWRHVPTAKGINIDCSCGRAFAHEEAWADHVRLRVQRYLNNQFPPIGEAHE